MITPETAIEKAQELFDTYGKAYDYMKLAEMLNNWLSENSAGKITSTIALDELKYLCGITSNEGLASAVKDSKRLTYEQVGFNKCMTGDLIKNTLEFKMPTKLNTFSEVKNSTETNDVVNHPSHYKLANGVEAIDLMEMTSTASEFCGHLRNTALKYIIRAGKKDPRKYIEDLEKAKWYISKLQEFYSKCENKEY